jgi:stage V sporulation protein SpoVS
MHCAKSSSARSVSLAAAFEPSDSDEFQAVSASAMAAAVTAITATTMGFHQAHATLIRCPLNVCCPPGDRLRSSHGRPRRGVVPATSTRRAPLGR